MSAHTQSTPVCRQTVPAGHILVSNSWTGTQLAGYLSKYTSVLYSDGLGIVDFYPSRDAAVIFVSEADIISGINYRRRIVRFRQANTSIRGSVIAQNTSLTRDQFCILQKFVSVELGLAILPIQTIEEAAQLLAQMVTCEAKFNSNPFRMKPKTASTPDVDLLKTMTVIPGLGDKRARQILQHFGSLQEISNTSQENLEKVVGAATASSVYKFFHQSFLL
ncbi:Fanconi anemia core complex-associated protein 24 isoform X2 [Procambarus clarkii]|uniref:Fanconi anemia core complex-associated protein 24 isoform X2 n=1 Tax=Procambarus clarkii TaxID=6728 RepID=UPI001E6733E3|nr:Fanconi anemia core complex-associated protein 24-like [Procambarus clarkii]